MKVCWTHQNMQQWSYCQGRWSVFIVDWANERGKERGRERKLEGERGGWLYCRRVLTISSLPHHRTRHKMATSFLLTAGTRRGGHLNHRYLISHLRSLFFNLNYFSYLWTAFKQHCWVAFYLHIFRPNEIFLKLSLMFWQITKLHSTLDYNLSIWVCVKCADLVQEQCN